ncbi:MAG: guanylate kinase [Bacteroidetes bacterium]|nr:guanylate kinase [Bacteroidota bacterium]
MQGKIVIVTAPSGAGKTTIVKHLLASEPKLAFSVSATTRTIRNMETDGKDYYFLSVEQFKEKINQDAFVEWEEVYPGKLYGTLKSEVERIWNANQHIIFDVDVKGALSLKNKYPEQTISLFIQPPSLEVLIDRLTKRNTETPETLKTRIERVKYELTFSGQFDHVIVNDELERAQAEALSLVHNFLSA